MSKASSVDDFLPFALPDIGDEEIAEVIETLRSGWLTTGPRTKQFETEFRNVLGSAHALAVNSATAGLHLGLEALGVKRGDKVATTVNTFTASAEVICYLGAHPVFVDIDKKSMNLDCVQLRQTMEQHPEIAAIMPVHVAGLPCNMEAIMDLSREYGVSIIEDAAHALPSSFRGQMIGRIGDVTVFSFYVTKTLATGEGGMVVTDDDEIAARMRTMRLHGISRDVFDRYRSKQPSWYYEIVAPGFKYNMPDIAAAIGIHQLRKLRLMQRRRQEIAEQYLNAFRDLPIFCPLEASNGDDHAWHLFIIQLKLEELSITRNQFIERMATLGIGTSVHFIPLHMQPYWRDTYGLRNCDYPVSTSVFERIVSLPLYSRMSDLDVNRVIEAVTEICYSSVK